MASGRFSLTERLEFAAEQLGQTHIRLAAWDEEAEKLRKFGKLEVTQISPTGRKGESNYEFDWSNAKVDMKKYSPKDPNLSRANRLWIMAYLSNARQKSNSAK